MNGTTRRVRVLLPAMLLVLASCGGNGGGEEEAAPAPTPAPPPGPTPPAPPPPSPTPSPVPSPPPAPPPPPPPPPPPAPAASPRYIEVWSSAATSAAYDLAVVDPDAPGTLLPVDQVPALSAGSAWMVHIHGGTWDEPSGTLADPGVRHVIYLKDGSLYRVTLDKGGAAPAAVRLSNETQAQAGSLFVAAQNRDGSDALLGYLVPSGPGSVPRYVGLSTPAANAPLAAPTFPGDPVYGHAAGWTLDSSTGAIGTLLWTNVTTSGASRLFRTDANLGNAAGIATFTNLQMPAPWAGAGPFNGGRMARGRFFIADGALRRHDDATGDIRLVFPDVTGFTGGGVFDDTHAYLRLATPAGPRLVRAPDAADSTGVAISSAAVVGDAAAIFKQTRDYVVFVSGGGATATSVRKSDGALATLPNAGGLLFTWNVAGAVFLLDGNTAGNRVWYSYAGVVGSVHADGSDRKEVTGNPTTIAALPAAVAPHRVVGANAGLALPFARFLVNAGNEKRWVDAASGDLAGAVGSLPAALVNAGASLPYYGFAIGRSGAFGIASSGRADAWLVSDQSGSLLRLTNHIP